MGEITIEEILRRAKQHMNKKGKANKRWVLSPNVYGILNHAQYIINSCDEEVTKLFFGISVTTVPGTDNMVELEEVM